jgi:hypothetical protein
VKLARVRIRNKSWGSILMATSLFKLSANIARVAEMTHHRARINKPRQTKK